MGKTSHGTSGGVDLSDQRVQELAEEAEGGYDPDRLRTRSRRGRPALGAEPARVFHVRLPPALRQALERQADKEATTPSDLVRRALRQFLSSTSEQGDPSHADR